MRGPSPATPQDGVGPGRSGDKYDLIDESGYLDQLVVNPDHWGSKLAGALVDEAKRLSPGGVTLKVNKDNARAIRFYERNGFGHGGEDVNPTSGRPVLRMTWRP